MDIFRIFSGAKTGRGGGSRRCLWTGRCSRSRASFRAAPTTSSEKRKSGKRKNSTNYAHAATSFTKR